MEDEPERRQSPGNLAWLDLEMTGLDPSQDVILQAALICTTADLEPLEELVLDVWQPPGALEGMVPFVRDMHDKTGLLARIATSKVDVRRAERELIQRITAWCPYPAILCGNSIGSDRRFVDRHMPGLAGYLHYRMIDVSTVKELTRLWHGESAVYAKPELGAHDALFDIRQSIAELRHYRATIFRARS